ncbi:MAG: NAD(P)H-dependent oxidoreductase subunit E [Cyanobacteria bacterium REEB498]|nr:NAD(P)H-dependent oxidoreductase subunit E [Cyanobacteria bacterium REEB498]
MAGSVDIPFGEQPDALEQELQRHGLRRDGLIEILTAAQRQHGWLSPTVLTTIATRLQLPLSQVLGTASFYHLFRFEPPLPHCCLVCTGTACHVRGAPLLLAALRQECLPQRGMELGEVRCIGSCSGAPLLVIDGQVLNHQSPASALRAVSTLAMAQL